MMTRVLVGADVVSSFVWRGSKVSGYEGITVQPTASVSVGNLPWGCGDRSIMKVSAKEADLYLSYSLGSLTLMVSDYWFGWNTTSGLARVRALISTKALLLIHLEMHCLYQSVGIPVLYGAGL
jgi:hypothetical protein